MRTRRVKVAVRPSAMHEDARIVEVTSPDGRSTVTIGVGFSGGRWLISDPRFHAVLVVDRCPVCKTPTHASESDDLGRCGPCAERMGEPHAEVQS